jgi:hypothetical protein
MFLRQSANFFFRCAAVHRVAIGQEGKKLRRWHVWLFSGNNPRWLEPHKADLLRTIREACEHARYEAAPDEIVFHEIQNAAHVDSDVSQPNGQKREQGRSDKRAETAAKAKATPRGKKEGLRKPQIRILAVLAKSDGWLSHPSLCQLSKADPTSIKTRESGLGGIWGSSDYLGYATPEARAKREATTGYPSLLTLRYIEGKVLDVEGKTERCYRITAAGKKALSAAQLG